MNATLGKAMQLIELGNSVKLLKVNRPLVNSLLFIHLKKRLSDLLDSLDASESNDIQQS